MAKIPIPIHKTELILRSVADPHHIDADPDHARHFNADADPACHFDADPDPACHFDADADPDPDQNPSFQMKAYILALHLQTDADPDPAYHSDVDADPDFTF
jgi:hypothetical protein